MSTTATSAPPQPVSESGHGVIAPYREILVDAFEPGDLPERQAGRRAERDDGPLPQRQAPRKSTRRAEALQ
jgi:hypothetical protein